MSFAALTSAHSVGSRKAALLVRSMNRADQVWLMSQLNDAQQTLLTTLQAELDAMGVTPALLSSDPRSVVKGVMSISGLTESAAPAVTDEDVLMALSHADVVALAHAFRHEPPGLVSRGLQLRDWPWRHRFLSELQLVSPGGGADRFDPPPWGREKDRAFDRALMRQMRLVCEDGA